MSTEARAVVSYTIKKNVDICYRPVLRIIIRYPARENDASGILLLMTGSEQGGNSTPILVIVGRPLLCSLIMSLVPGKNWPRHGYTHRLKVTTHIRMGLMSVVNERTWSHGVPHHTLMRPEPVRSARPVVSRKDDSVVGATE
jgi:hypothetical protein